MQNFLKQDGVQTQKNKTKQNKTYSLGLVINLD